MWGRETKLKKIIKLQQREPLAVQPVGRKVLVRGGEGEMVFFWFCVAEGDGKR